MIDPVVYESVMKSVEQLMATVQHLDWQLATTKHMLKKYKDLAIAQQLHINVQAVKLAAVKISRDDLHTKCEEMQDLVAQYKNRMVLNKDLEEQAKQRQYGSPTKTSSKQGGDKTPTKLGQLL